MRTRAFLLAALVALSPALALASPRILAAEHDGRVEQDAVLWQTRIVLDCQGADTVTLREGDSPISCGRKLRETSRQPLDRAHPALRPPLVGGDAVQIVTALAPGDERVEPSTSGLERHVGYWQSPGISDGARRDARELLGPPHPSADSIYLVDGSGRGTRPEIPVTLTTAAQRRLPAVVATTVASVLLVALLGCLYRRLSREVEIERAEAALRREFEGLEGR